VLPTPGTRPTDRLEKAVDTRSIRTPSAEVTPEKRLEELEETYRHEILDPEERLEVRERIERIRRRLRFGLSR
jgi:hypothetical protein